MALTIGNWVLIGLIALLGIGVSIYAFATGSKMGGIVLILITIIICVGLVVLCNWSHTSTASGIRSYKDFKSEMANGLEREITITAEDGREIFHYKGKFDVEMDNEGNYLRFETQSGKRFTVEYGIQDTVLLVEEGFE